MILVWILLVVGFVLLIKGADYFVEGSSAVAKILRIPSVVIGLTIVAMGTSAPELAVSVTAALTGNNEIAVGNVIGSNIFNLMVVTGTCGVIAYFIIKLVRKALKERTDAQEEEERLSKVKIFLYVVGGIVAIVFGGDIVVDCASQIASSFGLSQNLIGLTIVAMGTSLPELVTSIVASRKGENGLALGNVIGSNIFNILMILGISSAIHPIAVTIHSAYDLIVLIVFSTAVWLMARTKKEVNRGEGIAMLALYAGYMVYIILR